MLRRRSLLIGTAVALGGAVLWGRFGAGVGDQDLTRIRVACIGDSITYGANLADEDAYPEQLGHLLGPGWTVRNFGAPGATMLMRGNLPYRKQDEYHRALAFEPSIVVIQLGTNDSKPQNWRHREDYVADYLAMIESFRALPSRPEIWIARPVPAYSDRWGIRAAVIRDEVIPAIDRVAEAAGVQVIDLHAALAGQPASFPDTIHPNAEGALKIAEAVRAAITGPNGRPTS